MPDQEDILKKNIVFIFLLVVSSTLFAQVEKETRMSVGAFASIGIPVWEDIQDEWHDEFTSGFGSAVDISYRIAKKTHVLVRFSYQPFQPDLQEIRQEVEPKLSGPGSVTSTEGSCGLGIISIHAVRMLPWRGFNVSAGASYYYSFQDEVVLNISNFNYQYKYREKWHFPNGFGFNFGIGMDLVHGNRLSMVLESTFHTVKGDMKHTTWIQFLTGLRYHLTKG